MRTVLCYGDSNTWGWNPDDKSRYKMEERWPGVLRMELGSSYYIIEEALNGRTTVWEDPIMGYKSGKEYLTPCLESHKPIDLVIMMLGTNDLKKRFNLSPLDIAKGVETLVKMIKKSDCGLNGGEPKILLICPPQVGKLNYDFSQIFEGSEEKSKKLGPHYKVIAEFYGCYFLDASKIIISSDIDGIHIEKGEHKKLGKAVADIVKEIFKD
mgnify:CR=1 FL=1